MPLATALRLCALAFAVLLLPAASTSAADPAALDGELDRALAQSRELTGAPAATAAVLRCGQPLWEGASGVMDVDSQRPASSRTLFATASAGKPITAALVLDL